MFVRSLRFKVALNSIRKFSGKPTTIAQPQPETVSKFVSNILATKTEKSLKQTFIEGSPKTNNKPVSIYKKASEIRPKLNPEPQFRRSLAPKSTLFPKFNDPRILLINKLNAGVADNQSTANDLCDVLIFLKMNTTIYKSFTDKFLQEGLQNWHESLKQLLKQNSANSGIVCKMIYTLNVLNERKNLKILDFLGLGSIFHLAQFSLDKFDMENYENGIVSVRMLSSALANFVNSAPKETVAENHVIFNEVKDKLSQVLHSVIDLAHENRKMNPRSALSVTYYDSLSKLCYIVLFKLNLAEQFSENCAKNLIEIMSIYSNFYFNNMPRDLRDLVKFHTTIGMIFLKFSHLADQISPNWPTDWLKKAEILMQKSSYSEKWSDLTFMFIKNFLVISLKYNQYDLFMAQKSIWIDKLKFFLKVEKIDKKKERIEEIKNVLEMKTEDNRFESLREEIKPFLDN